jgi:hypothetical protein
VCTRVRNIVQDRNGKMAAAMTVYVKILKATTNAQTSMKFC